MSRRDAAETTRIAPKYVVTSRWADRTVWRIGGERGLRAEDRPASGDAGRRAASVINTVADDDNSRRALPDNRTK
jgi:hypothetical protein